MIVKKIKDKINNSINLIINQNQKKMKKIFTLTLVLFAMVFAGNAQMLLSEDFENGIPSTWLNIDADNDGNAWFSSENETGVAGHDGSNGCAYSCSYYDGTVLTPDNWLITPAVTLTGSATLTFWVAAQDASYAAEHYGVYISTNGGTSTSDFTLLYEETLDANGGARTQGTWKQKTVNLANYTGQTIRIAFRHFNCTDMFYMNLDDVVIFAQPTGPTIIAQPSSINFGTLAAGSSQTQSVDVVTYNLTAGVTATTAAPFAVSADGTTFTTTATVAAAGGTLYVQYAPTAVATDNGTVTLASTGATDVTISLTGAAIDCSAPAIPYSTDFTSEGLNQCWEVIDANEDGYTFEFNTTEGYASIRWNTTLDMDDWLISPAFALTGAQMASFDYSVASSSFYEKFQVFAFGANDTVTLTPVVETNNTTYETQYLDLSALNGNYKIAIHGISDADQFRLYITNFNVFVGAVPADLTLSTDELDFGTIGAGSTSNPKYVIMNTVSVDEAFTLTTAAPFEISLNGTTYATTQTIPANSALTTTDTIYVRFAPTTPNTYTGTLTITSTSFNETVALTGVAADCSSGITSFPFVYDFNTGVYPPVCWGYNDAENYWPATVDEDAGDYAMGISGVDMLVTPEITSTSPMAVMFDYRTYLGDNLDDEATSFRVGYSSTNDNASSFTWLPTVTVTSYPEGTLFFTYAGNVPANTKYVAIDFLSFGSYYGYYEDAVYVDNFKLVTDSYMAVNPESIDFGSIVFGSSSEIATVAVTAALLNNSISVNAPANFEVSSNGTTFAATATLPQEGGSFYVRYNPTAAGSHNGTITVTCGSITKNITVSGSAMDCSQAQALPFFEDFESDLNECWTILDEDGDGDTWAIMGMAAYEGDGCITSSSYNNGALTPDNWLISPALAIPSQGAKLSFFVCAQDASWAAEHYGVYVSTTGVAPNNFTLLYEEDLDADGGDHRVQGTWKEKHVNLPYGGQNIHIAIRHFDVTDMFRMNIDNISVTAGVGIEDHGLSTKVYPNPVSNVLNIDATANINRVEIFNMMGQIVGSYDANDVHMQINTNSFANGIYTVKISTEDGIATKKFTVAR